MSRVDEALARARRELQRSADADRPVRPGVVTGAGPDDARTPGGAADRRGTPPVAPPNGSAPGTGASWPEEAVETGAGSNLHAAAAPDSVPLSRSDVNGDASHVGAGESPLFDSEKLIIGPNVNSATVEQFRRLAAQLYLAQAERGIRAVMVASALSGEGKTLTAANLALTLSESYELDVLLVDGDLRRPCAHRLFGVPNISGLNDGVRAERERKVPLIRISPHLSLLTAGRPEADPMGVLSSDRIRQVLDEAREKFDWVIVDTPPLGLITDAHLLASLVDATVLVVRAAKTPVAAISRVVEAVGRDRIVGVVLNRVEAGQGQPEYGAYYYAGQPA